MVIYYNSPVTDYDLCYDSEIYEWMSGQLIDGTGSFLERHGEEDYGDNY